MAYIGTKGAHIMSNVQNKKQFDYQLLFESTGTGIAVIEADGRVSLVNKKLAQLLETDISEISTHSFVEWIYEEDRPMMIENHNTRVNGGKEVPNNYEFRILSKTKKVRWVLVNLVFLPDTKQTLTSLIDISRLKETETALQESLRAQDAILAAIPELMFELDENGYYLNVWAHDPKELSRKKSELLKKHVGDILPYEASREVMHAIQEAKEQKQTFGREIFIPTLSGKLWFELSVSIKPNLNAADTFIVLSRNITDRKELELKLLHLSNYDYLTNIYNRRMLIEQLHKDVHRAQRYNLALSVCMLDIDHFKDINDTYGHATGDKVLTKMSQLLQETLRETDYSGRYGGEEFIIVLPETSSKKAQELAERLRKKIAHLAIALDDKKTFHFTVSIGVASLTKRVDSLESLLQVSDITMYMAKNAGRNRIMAATE
jgi:diguanylate cyclase (GGDEF)-like protein/PAS domain S-box-containing protein